MTDLPGDPAPILPILGMPESTPASRVSGGADTAIWRIDHTSGPFALRVFRAGEGVACQRELAAMSAARGHVPVPELRAEGVWQDHPAWLLSWMPGQPLADALCAQPWRGWELGVAFGRTQAAIHAIPAPAALTEDGRSWVDWGDTDDALRDRLRAISSDARTLIHLDYHPRNVLVEGNAISAVIDWTNARAGDSRADLTRTAAILRFAPLCAELPAIASWFARRGFIAGWRHGYRGVAGGIHGMAPFYAWAGVLMVHDLAPRVGRPDLPWLTRELLGEVQTWADGWRARANIS
jgi:aminoglycoside phosphotransferase (APT) family kinase protein